MRMPKKHLRKFRNSLNGYWEAKQGKDWASADQLRDELVAKGWTVKDGKDGFDLVPLVS